MSSEIKVDTISENTSANGVAIDGVTLKDNGITASGDISFDGGSFVFNESSADKDFRIESNDKTNMFFVDGGNNRIGINTAGNANHMVNIEDVTGNGGGTLGLTTGTSGTSDNLGRLHFGNATDPVLAAVFGIADAANDAGALTFRTETSGAALEEAARFTSTQRMYINKSAANNLKGIQFGGTGSEGSIYNVRDGGTPLDVNRLTSDGVLVNFYQDTSVVGTITVSGSTVSYNAFTGSHWSRLADNSKPTILQGTIIESIDEMCDWYQAVANVPEVKYTAEDQDVIDGYKNVGDIKTEADKIIEPISLGSKSVGDDITFTSMGSEYTGKIEKAEDIKHTKCKISDTADSKKVYGVFSTWDDKDDGLNGDVNDMMVAQVGTYIIRVNKDVTVEAGDLLVSNGDGTAKVQDDDIIRSKTVAKVNSNIKVETYSDGSYTVPCTLHC